MKIVDHAPNVAALSADVIVLILPGIVGFDVFFIKI